MLEFIIEIVLLGILVYPGAAIRWLLSRLWGSKKTFKEFTKDDYYLNGMTGLITLGLLFGAILNLI
jgi:hypothetical protein